MNVEAFTPRFCEACKGSHIHTTNNGQTRCRSCGHVAHGRNGDHLSHDYPKHDGGRP